MNPNNIKIHITLGKGEPVEEPVLGSNPLWEAEGDFTLLPPPSPLFMMTTPLHSWKAPLPLVYDGYAPAE